MSNKKREFNIGTATEQLLDGVSHMLTKEDWDILLLNRFKEENPYDKSQGLSGAFIIKYRNKLNLSVLPAYLAYQTHNYEDLNIDFVRRFWKYIPMDAGHHATFHGRGTKEYQDLYKERFFKYIDTSLPYDLGLNRQAPVKLSDLDKHPFKYDIGVWNTVLKFTKEPISDDFINTYIHLIAFDNILTNPNLKDKDLEHIIDTFSIPVGADKKQHLFPDGALLTENEIIPGLEYYNSEQRFAAWDNTQDILTIAKKFKRALFDCEYPDNKEAMKDK